LSHRHGGPELLGMKQRLTGTLRHRDQTGLALGGDICIEQTSSGTLDQSETVRVRSCIWAADDRNSRRVVHGDRLQEANAGWQGDLSPSLSRVDAKQSRLLLLAILGPLR